MPCSPRRFGALGGMPAEDSGGCVARARFLMLCLCASRLPRDSGTTRWYRLERRRGGGAAAPPSFPEAGRRAGRAPGGLVAGQDLASAALPGAPPSAGDSGRRGQESAPARRRWRAGCARSSPRRRASWAARAASQIEVAVQRRIGEQRDPRRQAQGLGIHRRRCGPCRRRCAPAAGGAHRGEPPWISGCATWLSPPGRGKDDAQGLLHVFQRHRRVGRSSAAARVMKRSQRPPTYSSDLSAPAPSSHRRAGRWSERRRRGGEALHRSRSPVGLTCASFCARRCAIHPIAAVFLAFPRLHRGTG